MTTIRRAHWPTLAIICFVAATVAANAATARYGLIPVGFGLTATAGTYIAGLVLLLRDWVHDTAGQLAVYGCITAGAVASAASAGPRLAAASAAAFAVSELADLCVYQPLRGRGWAVAAASSNAVGAVVDTLTFLTLAGFPIAAPVVGGQLVGKASATLAVIAAVVMTRAVLRHRLRPDRA